MYKLSIKVFILIISLNLVIHGQCLQDEGEKDESNEVLEREEEAEKKSNDCITECDVKKYQVVEGIFDLDNLKSGYNDVLLIPAKAIDIDISEVEASRNNLAIHDLKGEYFLNGNGDIQSSSEIEIAGSTFRYEMPGAHPDMEKITSKGPITEPLIISIIYQETNRGIRYKYSKPIYGDEQTPSISFDWITDNEFEECSAACGEGVQIKKVKCIRSFDKEAVTTHFCDANLKPVKEERTCNLGPCSSDEVVDTFEGSGEGSGRREQLLEGDLEGSGIDVSNCTENEGGCGKESDCIKSSYGCCPDGVTSAKGEGNKGCPCEGTEFGCCPDGESIATGPDNAGCTCKHSKFGCCRDNYTEAKGTDNEGCDCNLMLHGCCPDSTVGATGPDGAGCGCETSVHGCCPDGTTPARGPNEEGCPCASTKHGCCPDRLSTAQGPDNEGCPCDSLPFGCCPNTTVPATGPLFAGCSCAETPYGCCADGKAVAYGPTFEGCPDGPPLDTTLNSEACSLPKERGQCRNYTVKWYFDMEYGGCTRFWYGGCEGNANRFNSQEECERICVAPEGPEACSLPKVQGPCEGNYQSWYYSHETKTCESFNYGGCLGNRNRFDTKEQCQELCASQPSSDPCEQPPFRGPCQGNHRRWYFSKQDGRCRQFYFGGCKANENNFYDERSCLSACSKLTPTEICVQPKAEGPCLGQYPRWYYDYIDSTCKEFTYTGCQGNKNRFVDRNNCEKTCNSTSVAVSDDVCSLPMARGPCGGNQARWFYSKQTGRCEQFSYGGCLGNANKFETRRDCERACIFKTSDERACSLPKEVGSCEGKNYRFEERWYYDSADKGCRRFYFSGCNGNDNNFRSADDCNQLCGRLTQEVKQEEQNKMVESATEFRVEHCKLPQDHGPCLKNDIRWWYDYKDGVCKEFYYGGCEGNPNRFSTRQECETKCWNSQPICSLPQVRGPCQRSFPQWYYDSTYGECLEFMYGGCSGNANRFSSKESCEGQCHGTASIYPPAPPEPQAPQSGVVRPSRDPSCLLQPDAGTCKAYIPSVYYDQNENSCKMFIYGGCGGNANRFETRKECESKCVSTTREKTEDEPNEYDSKEDVCRLSVDSGPCAETHARWFYDPTSLNCLPFVYGGCGGNKNRFKTSEICIRFCRGVGAPRRRPEDNVSYPDTYPDRNPNRVTPDTPNVILPIPRTPMSTTLAPEREPEVSTSGTGCIDSPFFSDCNLIIQNRYCSNLMYAKFCCQSCLLAGQLDPTGVAAAIRGTRSIKSKMSKMSS